MPPKKSASKQSPISKMKNELEKDNKLESNMNMIAMFIITVIITVLVIILHFSMYTWTEELEKQGCECSNMWHRKVVHWLALLFLILIPVNILVRYFKFQNNAIKIFATLIALTSVTYICVIIDYIRKLKQLGCECSESWKREYGYIFSIIYICFFSIFLFSAIIAGLLLTSKLK